MTELNRRNVLKGIGTLGVLAGGIGATSPPAQAGTTVSLEVDSGLGTGDGKYEAHGTAADSATTGFYHDYSLTAIADVASTEVDDGGFQDDETTKDEEVIASLHQRRRDCSNDTYYWTRIAKLSITACANRRDASTGGTVPTEGSGWAGTGDYKLKAKAVEWDDYNNNADADVDQPIGGSCHYEDDDGGFGEVDGDDYDWDDGKSESELPSSSDSTTFEYNINVGSCCDLCQSTDS